MAREVLQPIPFRGIGVAREPFSVLRAALHDVLIRNRMSF